MTVELNRLPLNALQAFALVARLGSIRAAAEALYVTHGAVSQQIKKLESHLDVALLERHGRRIKLTPVGKQLAEQSSPLLQQLHNIAHIIDSSTETGTLSVACTQDVMHWLLLHLQEFTRRYPSINVKFYDIPKGTDQLPEVEVGIMDVLPSNIGYAFTVLTHETYFPVASPDYVASNSTEADSWVLLHDDQGEIWSRWIEKTDLKSLQEQQQIFFPNNLALVTACKQGLGVALASSATTETELLSGELIRLSRQGVNVEMPYFAVTKSAPFSRKAQLFYDWFKSKSKQSFD